MNRKYLFGMLLSGAMLAACTADDLNTAPVAQEANPSAPVFNVTIEDEDLQNRGTYMGRGNGYKLSWTEDDLMSLFHGATAVTSLAGTQNAVYYGTESTEVAGKFSFATKAMVQPGYAVMVYPADVAFRNKTASENVLENAPVIMVSANQDPTTKDSTAYISEVLNLSINPKDATKNNAPAGFGYDYDIVLKRAVGTLHVLLNTSGAPTIQDVDPVEITAVKLTSTANSFATQGDVTSAASTAYSTSNPSWQGTTTIVSKTQGAVNKISSTDISNDTVTFTLLPVPTGNTLADCTMEVHTTYGVVTIENGGTGDQKIKPWVNASMKDMNVTEGLTYAWTALHGASGTSSTFKGNWIGKYANATINVDLSKAKLDKMHIKTSAELKSVLKVYDYNSKLQDGEKAVTLYLDGDDEGRFTIEDNETWQAVVDHMAAAKHSSSNGALEEGVDFVACNEPGETCSIVRLTNDDKANAKTVPSLLFTTNQVSVELDGLWNYNGVEYSSSAKNESLITTLNNVSKLEVTSGSTLTLAGTIIAYGNGTTENSGIKLVNEGTVEVTGTVTLKMNAENYGVINIEEDEVLGVANQKTLENMEARNPSSTKKATGWDVGGIINNEGFLAATGGTTKGAVNNYSLINNKGEGRTTVNLNARENVESLESAFDSGTTAIGTIKIFEPMLAENTTVTVGEENFQGFIALEVTKTDAKFEDFGDVANYIILSGNCAGVTFTEADEDGNFAYLPSTVKYIEINSSKEVKFTGAFELEGLFVKAGKKVNIPKAASVTVGSDDTTGEVFLKGIMSKGGSFVTDNAVYNGYHGGATGDDANIYEN